MAAIIGKRKIFLKISKGTLLGYPVGRKFDKITLSCTVKEIEALLCFSIFWQKFENAKWPPFLGRGKLARVHCSDTLWVENFDEIALSRTVKEIEANFCFAILGKNSKIQNGRHYWEEENFFENFQGYIAWIPCGSKIRQNHSILHG